MRFAALESFIGALSGMVRTNMVRQLYVELQPLWEREKAKIHDGQNLDWMVGNTGRSEQCGVYTNRRLYWCSFRKFILVGVSELVLRRYSDSGEVSKIGAQELKSFSGDATVFILNGNDLILVSGRATS